MSHSPAVVAAALIAGAYLVGSVPVAWLLARRRDLDLREVGSGNPGTSNLFRNAGIGAAMLAGPLQFAQGLVPVLAARAAGADAVLLGVVAVAAVAGNAWPVWLRFNGQRSIAVATGAVAGLNPVLLAVLLGFFAAGALLRVIAVGVLVGFAALPLVAAWLEGRALALTCCVLLGAVLVRRLEGVTADLRGHPAVGARDVLLRRLLLDDRPGQVLVGPREDTGTTGTAPPPTG